jgi:hypothetical protein
MENERVAERTGKWIFQLQQEQGLQFRIASEQEENSHILIEGHEISELLDYLYERRELIYEATHDQETRRREAKAAREASAINGLKKRRVEPTLYLDDGIQRTRATT